MYNEKLKPVSVVPVKTGIACNAANARAYGESLYLKIDYEVSPLLCYEYIESEKCAP